MKRVALCLISLLLCSCGQSTQKQDIQNITLENQTKIQIPAQQQVKQLKKEKDSLFFIDSFYGDNQSMKEGIYRFKENKKEKVVQTAYYQGNIHDFYLTNNYLVYSDYDPYDCQGKYIIVDSHDKQMSIDTTQEHIPSFYAFGNSVFYVKYDKNTKVMLYDIESKSRKVLAEYPLQEIDLGGHGQTVYWYINNHYYVYTDQLYQMKSQNTFDNHMDIDEQYLYALEKKDSHNMLVCYNFLSKEVKEYEMNVNDFVVSDDYLIVPYMYQKLLIYEKENMDKVAEITLDSVLDVMIVDDNICLVNVDENQYIEFDLDDYLKSSD